MPLVPYENALAVRGQTLAPREHPEEDDGLSGLDLAAAALRQNNVISGNYERSAKALFSPFGAVRAIGDAYDDLKQERATYDPNYDGLTPENLAGFEQHAERFIDSHSPEQSARIKQSLREELADMRVI